jgi:hypothetical protein
VERFTGDCLSNAERGTTNSSTPTGEIWSSRSSFLWRTYLTCALTLCTLRTFVTINRTFRTKLNLTVGSSRPGSKLSSNIHRHGTPFAEIVSLLRAGQLENSETGFSPCITYHANSSVLPRMVTGHGPSTPEGVQICALKTLEDSLIRLGPVWIRFGSLLVGRNDLEIVLLTACPTCSNIQNMHSNKHSRWSPLRAVENSHVARLMAVRSHHCQPRARPRKAFSLSL